MTTADRPAEPAAYATTPDPFTAGRVPSAEPAAFADAPDGLELLRRDHQSVARLLAEYDQASGPLDKVAVAERLCLTLAVHARIEEELFYPALREAGVDPDRIDNAQVEHLTARQLIADVETAAIDDPLLDAKVRVLGVYSLRHAAEEEAELFEAARVRGVDVHALGAKLAARKAELSREAALNLKTRLRASGPATQLEARAPKPTTPAPLRAAGAAADLALAVMPGGKRLRKLLR
ncbi:hemerythrin domain-containing protein, partial [Caulobacter sp. 17J65-9]|uniref:hemerythrin domain-containing protein n=1 Tax=Caulobacter sp. 17J65-9 TaxID=2709382 RepID=UPI0013CB8B83